MTEYSTKLILLFNDYFLRTSKEEHDVVSPCEVLFTPSLRRLEFPSVAHVLASAIQKSTAGLIDEPEERFKLMSAYSANIILSGGGTSFPGFASRLSSELAKIELLPPDRYLARQHYVRSLGLLHGRLNAAAVRGSEGGEVQQSLRGVLNSDNCMKRVVRLATPLPVYDVRGGSCSSECTTRGITRVWQGAASLAGLPHSLSSSCPGFRMTKAQYEEKGPGALKVVGLDCGFMF